MVFQCYGQNLMVPYTLLVRTCLQYVECIENKEIKQKIRIINTNRFYMLRNLQFLLHSVAPSDSSTIFFSLPETFRRRRNFLQPISLQQTQAKYKDNGSKIKYKMNIALHNEILFAYY